MLKGVHADCLVTGEMSHVSPESDRRNRNPTSTLADVSEQHEVLAAVASGQTVILTNHSNSERPYLSKILRPWLQDELNKNVKELDQLDPSQEDITSVKGEWEVLSSKVDRDPLRTE